MELVFASNNAHKLKEVRNILAPEFIILSLSEIGCFEELPETSNSLEGNASQKANYIYKNYKVDCFADDTGLEIEALDGRPGVFSARYAGADCDPEDNIRKVLIEMEGIKKREAKFRSVLSLIIKGNEKQFEGLMHGFILTEKHGKEGFGYDPVFAPARVGDSQPSENKVAIRSFAEMSLEEKNRISHRALAVRKMREYLLTPKR